MVTPDRRKYLSSLRYQLFFSISVFAIVLMLLLPNRKHQKCAKDDWDVLIFTQRWPNTVCMKWQEIDPANHSCQLPKEDTIWTIHGIWPTKFGTLGPTFCNTSYEFNSSQLLPIQNNLTEYWPSVEAPRPEDSFWRHEWRKHGTCCSSVPTMNTELKYFTTGLEWLGKYNMRDVLMNYGVSPSPNRSTELTTLWMAVKTQLGFNPSLHCVWDKKSLQFYLQEIRICFDKSLKLTDCDSVKANKAYYRFMDWKPLGNCPNDKPIFYPSIVPPVNRKPIPIEPTSTIITVNRIVKIIMWFTF